MNRIIIFAHFDKNNLIQDYVVYYLSELKKIAEKIIFVSDSDISPKELKKINNIIEHSIVEKHGEYDFGSYKRGFIYAKENGLLNNCEELIFANDSCYAPLYPFNNMFTKMSSKPNDFWGATFCDSGLSLKNGKYVQAKINHLQSFFVVFKPTVFKSELFCNFIYSITKENTKEEIITKYEVGMSKLLGDNGFLFDAYSNISKKVPSTHINAYHQAIIEDKLPFLKRSITLYTQAEYHYPILIKYLIKKYTNYNYSLIEKDIKQNARKLTKLEHIKFYIKSLKRFIFRRKKRDRLFCILGKWYTY